MLEGCTVDKMIARPGHHGIIGSLAYYIFRLVTCPLLRQGFGWVATFIRLKGCLDPRLGDGLY